MSVQKVSVLVPPLRAVPPGADWAANAIAWLFANDRRHPGRVAAWLAAARERRQAARAARRDAHDADGPGRPGAPLRVEPARVREGSVRGGPVRPPDLIIPGRVAGVAGHEALVRERLAILVLEAPICSGLRALYKFR